MQILGKNSIKQWRETWHPMAFALVTTLIFTAVFSWEGSASKEGYIYAADPDPEYTLEYPWSANPDATGDYIADSYKGILPGQHVIEDVTQARLLDILSAEGTYYILFGGPEHKTTQRVLPTINEQASASAVEKIYHFDPFVDGFQIDITGKSTSYSGIAPTWKGDKSSLGTSAAPVSEIWDEIVALLPSATAIADYNADDTLLFRFSKENHADLATETAIEAAYELTTGAIAGFDAAAEKRKLEAFFKEGGIGAAVPGDIRSEYDFLKREYDAGATRFNTGNTNVSTTPTPQLIGTPVEIFLDADYPDGEGFNLHQVTAPELFNILNSPGEHIVLFGTAGCHNTQAIIGDVAKRAKATNKKVYLFDPTLDSPITYGTGDRAVNGIDSAVGSTANTGLYVRKRATASTFQFSYIYAEITKYFGIYDTENHSKQEEGNNEANILSYYPNGDTDATLVNSPSWSDDTLKTPRRLQVPFLVAVNKDAPNKTVKQWIHKDDSSDEYSEYMLDLAWVRATPEARASTRKEIDGLSRVEIADEAVKALDNIFTDNKVTFQFTSAPTPQLNGQVKIGSALTLDEGTWSQSPTLRYQWLADGQPIPGAAGAIGNEYIKYTVKTSDAGKRISVSVTGSRTGYATATKTSAQTATVALNVFTTAPTPEITGTAKIGNTLGLNWGSWAPWIDGAAFSFQWYRNGKATAGATGTTYKLVAADVGKKITAAVTASAPGYATTTKVSAPTVKVVGKKFSKSPVPKITGTAKVGKKLKVTVGTWSPKAKYTYQWYANGKAIKGATKATLKLKKAQKGKKITVKVTGKKSGYDTVTKKSKATKKVK